MAADVVVELQADVPFAPRRRAELQLHLVEVQRASPGRWQVQLLHQLGPVMRPKGTADVHEDAAAHGAEEPAAMAAALAEVPDGLCGARQDSRRDPRDLDPAIVLHKGRRATADGLGGLGAAVQQRGCGPPEAKPVQVAHLNGRAKDKPRLVRRARRRRRLAHGRVRVVVVLGKGQRHRGDRCMVDPSQARPATGELPVRQSVDASVAIHRAEVWSELGRRRRERRLESPLHARVIRAP